MLRRSNEMIDEIVPLKFNSSANVAVLQHGAAGAGPAVRPI
jgi:hypothetical protein